MQLGDGEGVMRSSVLLVLDSEEIEVGLDEAMDLVRRVRQIIKGVAQRSAKLFIKKVYGWHKTEQLMTAPGVKAGWRQGCTGESEDVIPYLGTSANSFALKSHLARCWCSVLTRWS